VQHLIHRQGDSNGVAGGGGGGGDRTPPQGAGCEGWRNEYFRLYIYIYIYSTGTAVAQCLRCCATIRKVAGSISAGVSGFFVDIKFDPMALWPWGRLSL